MISYPQVYDRNTDYDLNIYEPGVSRTRDNNSSYSFTGDIY